VRTSLQPGSTGMHPVETPESQSRITAELGHRVTAIDLKHTRYCRHG
jgi:hypothetical protein